MGNKEANSEAGQDAPPGLEDLKENIRLLQENGSLKDLAGACCALLARNAETGIAPDAQALDIVSRIVLLGTDEVEAGRVLDALRAYPALLASIASQTDILLQNESAEDRRMLLALFNLSINRFGFLIAPGAGKSRIVDISLAGYLPDMSDPASAFAALADGASGARPAGATHPFTVVSFYTAHNEYAGFAKRLDESLQTLGIRRVLHAIEVDAAWEIICARKARFILDCWEASDGPVVWIDADATVEQYPALFDSIDADFAVHKWDGFEFGSGTLYFGKTESAHRLLQQWVLRCEADPVTWDQVHLQSAWCDIAATRGLRTAWLPRSYLQIFDAPEEEAPVIRHWQASRALKEDGRTTGEEVLHYSPVGAELRRSAQPWRSAEASFWIDEGVRHIIPEVGNEFPEGFDVGQMLHQSLDDHFPLLEVGCGVGRIAQLFAPADYIGADINPHALIQARKTNPHHLFRIADVGLRYPSAPAALVYTVLLHVADADLESFVTDIAWGRRRVVIAELMDRRWRRSGMPPVFNRDPEDYIDLMQRLGFGLTKFYKHEYERYAQPPFNVGKDSRLTSLVFDRVQRR